ncbi:MAG: PQQ-binding-like beta-propeller repeat protein [Verrucomicrobiales bacterium]|nr:PQQ-binding-like beta-propeller repeat protein [Verrucomicrobiales bacterium]
MSPHHRPPSSSSFPGRRPGHSLPPRPVLSPLFAVALASASVAFVADLRAADHGQLGQAWSRNMVSAEAPLPATFDPDSGRNVRWSVPLGTETHSTPVVARGRIFVGTNNGEPRDTRHSGDRGVLMALDEARGSLLWQLVVPKRVEDVYFDWKNAGISSTATAEGDRVYVVDNRGVVLCLDVHGLANGNDGPFRNESIYYAPQPTNRLDQGAPAAFRADGSLLPEPPSPPPQRVDLGPLDADIVWFFDLTSGAGIWSHDASHSSILVRGDHLYLNTGTGVDNTHRRIRRPDAPSLVVLDKHTGRLLARDREGIGPNIFHSTWAPPSLARIEGREALLFAAGNGILYAFEPFAAPSGNSPSPGTEPASLRRLWSFDFDPDAPKTNVHRFHLNKQEGPSNFYGAPVPHEAAVYLAGGGDLWWGKNAAWLKRIDVADGKPALRWSRPLVRHTFSTPAIHDGLVFVTDCSQNLHCFDADSGTPLWVQELEGETWASPFVADRKVYVGTRRGTLHVLAAAREKKSLATLRLGSPISATTVAANGVLYVATMNRLFAVAEP